MKLTVRKSDFLDDWWVVQPCLGNADIEGPSAEMLAIAAAIETGTSASFMRCAATHTQTVYLVCSPRNSTEPTEISHDDARALAAEIRAKVNP